ncbi:hypothetical protein [Ramlibacter albus]|uniref:Uncharacterized protein n=1 Tax=Ramlibacter albus TaxID=2079448 RepID=A0A923M868_9BURK|nr:hypothetical protein [Ramlibacter albus]MBC5765175.1 hypothetical protein [Ramlibacter albus]
MKRIAAWLVSAVALPALAHGGHGAVGEVHWHATDTAGFMLVVVLATLAILLSRGE